MQSEEEEERIGRWEEEEGLRKMQWRCESHDVFSGKEGSSFKCPWCLYVGVLVLVMKKQNKKTDTERLCRHKLLKHKYQMNLGGKIVQYSFLPNSMAFCTWAISKRPHDPTGVNPSVFTH